MEMGERLRRKQKEVFLFCWTGYFLTYFGRLNLSVAMNAMALEFASGAAVIGLTGSVFSGLVIQLGLGWNSVFLVWLALTVMGIGALGVFGWKYKAQTGR